MKTQSFYEHTNRTPRGKTMYPKSKLQSIRKFEGDLESSKQHQEPAICYAIEMNPFPAVRVNGKNGKFAPRAKAYHAKREQLTWLLKQARIKPTEKIGIQFVFPIPKSWSKKKRAKMIGQPHKQTPDLDNCIKSVKDSVYNGQVCDIDDKRVSEYGLMRKLWGEKGLIIITFYKDN